MIKRISSLTKEIEKTEKMKKNWNEKLEQIEILLFKLKILKDIRNLKRSIISDITFEALENFFNKQKTRFLNHLVDEIHDIWKIFFPSDERKIQFDNNFIPFFKTGDKALQFENISAGEKMCLLIIIKTVLLRDFTEIPFLILDEPIEHLDSENRIQMFDYLINFIRKNFIKQLIITTFEEPLTRLYGNDDDINIISLPSLIKS